MKLADPDRQLLAEEIIAARWNPEWRPAWASELERRRQRLVNGDDRELTVEEFFQRSLALRVAFSSAARRDRQNAEAWYASRSRVALESFISELGAAVRFISDLRELHSFTANRARKRCRTFRTPSSMTFIRIAFSLSRAPTNAAPPKHTSIVSPSSNRI